MAPAGLHAITSRASKRTVRNSNVYAPSEVAGWLPWASCPASPPSPRSPHLHNHRRSHHHNRRHHTLHPVAPFSLAMLVTKNDFRTWSVPGCQSGHWVSLWAELVALGCWTCAAGVQRNMQLGGGWCLDACAGAPLEMGSAWGKVVFFMFSTCKHAPMQEQDQVQ